jgi:hypothetical protein
MELWEKNKKILQQKEILDGGINRSTTMLTKKDEEDSAEEITSKVTKKFKVDALDYQGSDMFSLQLTDKILFTR